MAQSFFIWNGIDCRSKGVIMRGPAPIVRPEERVKHVEIPGIAGDLTETEGDDIYNSYIQTITISVRGAANVRNIHKWLRGAGFVTFSGEPDRRQKARVIGAITLNRISRNLDHWAGEVQFYCQPFKQKVREEPVTLTASGTVRNNGDVTARPLYKATTSGTAVGIKVENENTPEGNMIVLAGVTSGAVIWIDSETMEVLNADRTASLTKLSAGKFPVLGVGNNTVTLTNISSVEITKRERYL